MSQLLQNALYGGAVILVAAALRRLLKDRLAPGARLALWAVCLFRLLTPIAPESVLSLWGLGRLFAPENQAASESYAVGAAPSPGTSAPAVPAPQPDPGISWQMVLGAVWLAVCIVLAARYVLSYARTRRAVSCAVLLGRDDPRYALLPRCARLREGPMEGAPLTFGAVRPTVVLSPGLEGPELECVLAHEAVHARRRDNLWHYAMALAQVVYWWNPAVWLMSRLLRRDVELSCDRAALKRLGEDRRADYAEALVSLGTKAEGPAFCQTFGRKAAEERIISIMKYKKTTIVGAALSLALVLAVTVGFASSPAAEVPDEDSTTSSTSAPLTYGVISDPDSGGVLKYEVNLEYLEKNLARHVADGTMSERDAAWYLALARTAAMDGTTMRWIFTEDSRLALNDLHDICRRDEDGNLIPVDAATVVSEFVFGGTINGRMGVSEPNAMSGNYAESGYFLKENDVSRVYDDDGNLLAVGTPRTPFGTPLCDGSDCDIAKPHIHYNGQVIYVDYQDPYTPPAGAIGGGDSATGIFTVDNSVPVPSVAPAKAFDDYTIVGMDENGYPLDEQGNHLVFDENGGLFMKFRAGYGPCIKEDCPITEAHYHKDGQVVPISEDDAPTPAFTPDVGTAPMQAPYCPVCTDTRLHLHVDGQIIPLADPCPVEGCTITGNHIHGDVCYSCNGAGHNGGVCDGSCYTYNQPG